MQGDEPTSGLNTMSLGRHGDRSSFTDYGEVVIGSPDPVRDSHAEDGKVGAEAHQPSEYRHWSDNRYRQKDRMINIDSLTDKLWTSFFSTLHFVVNAEKYKVY